MSGQIAHALEDAAKKAEQGLAKDFATGYHDILKETEQKTGQVADHVAENEAKTVDDIGKAGEHARPEVTDPHPSEGGTPRGSAPGGEEPGGSGRDQVSDPHDAGRPPDAVCDGGEPVDMATGRMFIDQSDAFLPGTLPLEFTRCFESGYRAGRWMGRRWVCTFDERLEIDDEGVVHVGADRRTQAYPHPEPGRPVQASAGARRDLDVEHGERGYTLADRASGLVREFTVQPGGREALLTKVRNRSGDHYTLVYDRDGIPQAITHSGGYRLLVTVADGRITELLLADAAEDGGDQFLLRYGYTDGHLSEVYNSSGLPMRFANDAWGRITSWTDRNNSQYSYTYDERGRVLDEGGADGSLRFTFHYGDPDPATGLRTNTETNALGHTTTYEVNGQHQITAVTDPLGNTTRYERDRRDRLLAETDPIERTVRYTYDKWGDLTEVVQPDGTQTTASYDDGLSLPVVITGPDGASWSQTFDGAGRRTSLTDPLGATTHYTWDDDSGHLAAVTDSRGHTTHVTCDLAGLPIVMVDPLDAVTRIERDAFGRPVLVTDPLGNNTATSWTLEGLPATRTHPDGAVETWTWDAEGNLLEYTDPLGQTTTFEYTHFETLTARTTPDGARVTFTHDAHMQPVAVTNALGQHWTYAYDSAGHLTHESDYDGRTTTYSLDAAGQLLARTNPAGQVTRYRYDQLGRLVAKEGDDSTAEYSYDLAGNLAGATSSTCSLTRAYDLLGNLLRETVSGRTLEHIRDSAGRRIRRTTPSGHTTEWGRDASGSLTAIRSHGNSLDLVYDAAGREYSRSFNGVLTLNIAWDNRDRPITQTLSTAGPAPAPPLLRRTYEWCPDDSLAAITDQHRGTRRFALDPIGRATSVRAADRAESYSYNLTGDLTDAHWGFGTTTGAAEGTRVYVGTTLVSAGRIRYEHDEAGRVVVRQVTRLSRKPDTWRYTWNNEDQLTAVTTPDGNVWHYSYDPLGRRTAKFRLDVDGAVVERTDFTWDGFVLVEQTVKAPHLPGPHTITWEHDGFTPLAQSESITSGSDDQARVDRRFFAIVTDLVGTPTELIDPADGTIAWRSSTTLWGNTTWPSGSTTYTPLRFPGQYFDPESRLHYNVHRYYDPETARYTTPDPLGLRPGPNALAFVPNPLTWTDPLGLSPHRKSSDEQEINWSPKSVKTFGHTFSDHGQKRTVQQMADRARNKGGPQGKWLDDAKAAEVMRANHRPGLTRANQSYGIDIPEGLGVEISEDGTVVPVLRATVVPSPGGLIKSGYPTSKSEP